MKTTIASRNLIALIDATMYAASKDKSLRSGLCSIRVECEPTSVRAIATDAHILAYAERQAAGDTFAFALRTEHVRELRKILRVKGETTIDYAEHEVRFTTPNGTVTAVPLLTYPNWWRVIPADFVSEIRADRSTLLTAFQKIAAAKSDKLRCTVTVCDSALLLCHDTRKTRTIVPTFCTQHCPAAGYAFAINVRYAVSILRAMTGEEVRIRSQKFNTYAVRIDDGCDSPDFAIAMPMQLA